MRHSLTMTLVLVVGVVIGGRRLEARERPIEELPKDMWDMATVWTEPIKSAAEQSRRFDPVSGLWFGLLEGSVKSVERTTKFLIQDEATPGGAPVPAEQPLLRYNF